MATPKAIIQRALRVYGALGIGETAEAAVITSGLEALNAMLDVWNTEKLTVYAVSRTTKVLSADDGDYTIGAGGDIAVTQPIGIESASIIPSSQDNEVPIDLISAQEWAALIDKTSTGQPSKVYFQKGITNSRGTLYLYLIPDAAHTLVLYLNSQFAQIAFADIDTDYTLPAAALEAMVFNLAFRLAAEDGKKVSDEAMKVAQDALAAYKISNHRPLLMGTDYRMNQGCHFDIYQGDYR